MALPKIQHKLYDHELVGMKKKIKFRAFTVAEQKILLQAKEEIADSEDKSGHDPRVLSAVSQLIENCTLGKIDASKMCTFDIEDLFIRLRAKSVGEVFTVRYRETYYDDDGVEKTNFINVPINLDEVKVTIDPEHKNVINVTEDIGVVMRYPTFEMLCNCADSDELAMACIESIFNKDEMFDPDLQPKEELIEFYDSIEALPLREIKKFFDTMPKLKHTVTLTLHDGKTQEVHFEGLESFFG